MFFWLGRQVAMEGRAPSAQVALARRFSRVLMSGRGCEYSAHAWNRAVIGYHREPACTIDASCPSTQETRNPSLKIKKHYSREQVEKDESEEEKELKNEDFIY